MKRVLLQERIVLHQLQSLRRVTTVLRIENERASVSPSSRNPQIVPSSHPSSSRAVPRRPRRASRARPLRLAFARASSLTFWVMYRDIPCTPLSFCSVHSRVTCRRTSFFLLAAVTTSAPRERSLALAADGRAASELVEQTLARAASMASRGAECRRGDRAADVGIARVCANSTRALFMGWSVGPRAWRTAREPRAPTRATRVRDADARAVMSADASTRRFKIYTKTGDAGTSSLYNCERRDKDDAAFDALVDVDECNVACWIALEFCVDENNVLEAQVRRRRRHNARGEDEATTRGERRLTGTTNDATRSSRRFRVDCSTLDRRWRRRCMRARTR